MNTNYTFEQFFNGCCDFIGNSYSHLINELGEPDKEFESESGYLFLFYFEANVVFRTSKDKQEIELVVTPSEIDEEKFYNGWYNTLGVKLGDSYERIVQMWGPPSQIKEDYLHYNTNYGKTSDGVPFEVILKLENNQLIEFHALMFNPNQSKAKSGCFIATACYDGYDKPEVLELRKFRDKFLAHSYLGRKLVDLYYKYSPNLAQKISDKVFTKYLIKVIILNPIVKIIKLFNS